MTIKNDRFDIAGKIGGITSKEDAMAFFETQLDPVHLSRIRHIRNPDVLIKIANAVGLCEPDYIFINTGTEADRQFIRDLALKKGEESPLPMEGHTIHFDLKEEQGRIIDRTF